jgi:hypothetical protein
MVRAALISLFLAGCGPAPTSDHTLGEMEAFLEAAQMLTDGHGAAVRAAATVDEANGAEATYLETWTALGGEIGQVMTELEDCDLNADATAHLDATRANLDDLNAEMDAHAAQHAACATIEECAATEDGHATTMGNELDDCVAHHEAMHDEVTRAPPDDDMGGMAMR